MQVARAGAPAFLSNRGTSVPAANRSASYVPLYLTSSLKDVSFDIEELECIALDRLKVLKASEAARGAAPSTGATEVIRKAIRAAERANGLNIPPLGNVDREERVMRDEASHFLLRLALCTIHEHRNWMLTTECDLFNARLEGADAEFSLQAIEKANGPVVRPLSADTIDRYRQELDAVARGPLRQKGDGGTRYYEIAFEEVPSLVRNRKVLLVDGKAFVPERSVLEVVSAQFRSKLSQALVTASKAVALADNDERMHPILQSIRDRFAADDPSAKGFDPSVAIERINLNQLNESIPAMPLCMANMMSRLREQHHLRHAARMQLGVFLKGCGLTLDESMRYWRTEFGKGDINGEKFEKAYAYNIRHHYGKEGKRRNLSPFPCIRIINDRPGPGEHNGCPYREFEENRLKQALRSVQTDPNAIPAIVARAKDGNFQTACGMCFASTQPGFHAAGENGAPEFIPSHPNEYFMEARRRMFAPADQQMVYDEIGDDEMLEVALAAENKNFGSNEPGDASADGGQAKGSGDMRVENASVVNSDEAVSDSGEGEKKDPAEMVTSNPDNTKTEAEKPISTEERDTNTRAGESDVQMSED